jgi:hypothetical protein
VPGGLKVIVDERGCAGMQQQIPGFAALAGHLEVRHAFAFVPGILDLELAQFLAAQRVEQQRRQNGAIPLALGGLCLRRIQQLARLMMPSAGVLPSPLSVFGRLTPFTGLCVTAFFSQRYSNSDASEESRCRIVLPLSSRRLRSSRQAMMCARVTVRNSSGRTMPVKRVKSRIAFL